MVPIGDPRLYGPVEVQYVGDRSHGHEGGHRIAVAGREILALPDGRTTARDRSHAITRVLHADQPDALDRLEAVLGSLVLAGATNILVDGQPLIGDDTPAVSLRLDIFGNGTLNVTSLGGAT
jgi:hypothetical protein